MSLGKYAPFPYKECVVKSSSWFRLSQGPLWAWPTILSLDAPLVAILWQSLFHKSFGVPILWQHPVILGLCVWLIYVADRLLDSFKLNLKAKHTVRHAFYLQHRPVLTLLWLLVAGVSSLFVFMTLNPKYLFMGFGLLMPIILYGLAVHFFDKTFYKELYVGILFAFGTSLLLWPYHPKHLVLACLFFACLCSLNCLFISLWEKHIDAAQAHPSKLKQTWLSFYLAPLCLGFALSSLFLAWIFSNPLYLAMFFSALSLYILHHLRKHFTTEALRVLADVALLCPLFFLLSG